MTDFFFLSGWYFRLEQSLKLGHVSIPLWADPGNRFLNIFYSLLHSTTSHFLYLEVIRFIYLAQQLNSNEYRAEPTLANVCLHTLISI